MNIDMEEFQHLVCARCRIPDGVLNEKMLGAFPSLETRQQGETLETSQEGEIVGIICFRKNCLIKGASIFILLVSL
ncbi:unnamed protein product [Callosobruchus maculatus]|uniref:Uncharacterized protein n=1 Tax=Callosobruchus maculatus TaxID=64391 RepID=A0A653DTK9_CALMS|nr:unnamed protein product [Callosobruchus maculatus]